MRSRSRTSPLLAVAILGSALMAPALARAEDQPTLKISGSMRLRYETLDGQVRPGFNSSDSLVDLRTILAAEYRTGHLRIGGELWDSRAWGANRRTPISTNEVNVLEPVQAYVAVDGATEALGAVSAQVGRMALNLGSRRLVAADDYRNTVNSYTGVRLDLAPAGVKTTLIYVEPQLRLPDAFDAVLDNKQKLDRESSALVLWGGIAARPKTLGPATLEAAYFHLDEHDTPGRPTRDRDLDNLSLRVIRDPVAGKWDYEAEGIRQTGTISRGLAPTEASQPVNAGFAHLDAGYSFQGPWRVHLSTELDVATGDKAGGNFGRFDSLFGTRRSELAPTGLYAAIGRTNMISPGFRLELTPAGKWDGFITGRGLWLEALDDVFSTTGVRDPAGRSGRYAGVQVEGRVRYWLIKDRLRAEFDGVWLAKGGFLQHAPNAPQTGADEHYASFNLTSQF